MNFHILKVNNSSQVRRKKNEISNDRFINTRKGLTISIVAACLLLGGAVTASAGNGVGVKQFHKSKSWRNYGRPKTSCITVSYSKVCTTKQLQFFDIPGCRRTTKGLGGNHASGCWRTVRIRGK